jgi:cell division protease FtsH
LADELDALAKSRSFGGATSNDERDQTLNQLLTEMDGFPSQSSDVTIIVIAATNRADVLDPAILRRFDRQIHVPYPDGNGRQDILKIHARRIQCRMDQINWELLASHEMTGQFSGSDLRNVVNDAALLAVRDRCTSVKQSHLLHAIRRSRAMKVNTSMGSGTLWSLSNDT